LAAGGTLGEYMFETTARSLTHIKMTGGAFGKCVFIAGVVFSVCTGALDVAVHLVIPIKSTGGVFDKSIFAACRSFCR